MEPKRMTVKEFRELGYLQELNRQFLHPLGLALEVRLNSDNSESFGEVWDYRDDPEGITYGPDMIDPVKAERVLLEGARKIIPRIHKLGYIVQPVDSLADTEPKMTETGHDGWRGLFRSIFTRGR